MLSLKRHKKNFREFNTKKNPVFYQLYYIDSHDHPAVNKIIEVKLLYLQIQNTYSINYSIPNLVITKALTDQTGITNLALGSYLAILCSVC